MTATFAQLASQHVSFWRSGILPTCVRLVHTVENKTVKTRPEYAGFTMRQEDMQVWRLFLCIFLKACAHHQDRFKTSGCSSPPCLTAVDRSSCQCNPHDMMCPDVLVVGTVLRHASVSSAQSSDMPVWC